MIKIRKLRVTGFRGARFDLPLDFTSGNKSLSVFGENASGKSTVTDALEWFIRDRVDHLWREDCKEESLRNVLLDAADSSEVSVQFSDGTEGTKAITSTLAVTGTNKTLEFQKLIAKLQSDNIFLRHAQITEFIQRSKSEKRKAVASIIGYDSISSFRNIIQSTLNTLQKDRQFQAARHRAEEEKSKLLELTGKMLTSPEMLYEQISADLRNAGFDLAVTDKSSYHLAAKELREKINQEDRVEKKLLLDEMLNDMNSLDEAIRTLESGDATLKKYNDLVREKVAISQIRLSAFLSAGAKILDSGYIDEANCPFCLSPYDLTELRSEVEKRLKAISDTDKKLEAASPSVELFLSKLLSTKSTCDKLNERYRRLEECMELQDAADAMSATLAGLHSDISNAFKEHDPIEIPEDFLTRLVALKDVLRKQKMLATELVNALNFNEYEKRVISLIERMRDLREAFFHYDTNAKAVVAFEKQILSLGEIFDRFVLVQNRAMQEVLDKISDDVGRYYNRLHPDENVNKVRLTIVGEEGIEFEYYFHNKRTHPPMKYLSESHLNSLGIVLFFASAKLFNRTSKFLVLDDIVTSFDVNHRRRLLRLIKEEFADWQIMLLTHEAFWFDIIKRELQPEGWLIREMCWDDENGIQIEPSSKDLIALIESKRKKFDVSNDLRKLLEATLKEICFRCNVKVAFRYNDHNERRMSGELLSELKSTVNRRCAELKDNRIFSNLEGSNLVATAGSHHNIGRISGGDVDMALADIKQLHDLFACSKCGGYVEAARQIAGKNRIACRCGKKELDWK